VDDSGPDAAALSDRSGLIWVPCTSSFRSRLEDTRQFGKTSEAMAAATRLAVSHGQIHCPLDANDNFDLGQAMKVSGAPVFMVH
jgi:hypothetical protein